MRCREVVIGLKDGVAVAAIDVASRSLASGLSVVNGRAVASAWKAGQRGDPQTHAIVSKPSFVPFELFSSAYTASSYVSPSSAIVKSVRTSRTLVSSSSHVINQEIQQNSKLG